MLFCGLPFKIARFIRRDRIVPHSLVMTFPLSAAPPLHTKQTNNQTVRGTTARPTGLAPPYHLSRQIEYGTGNFSIITRRFDNFIFKNDNLKVPFARLEEIAQPPFFQNVQLKNPEMSSLHSPAFQRVAVTAGSQLLVFH